MHEARVRLFIALETPPEVREALGRTVAELKAIGADVRWEQVEKLHATVKFLGDTPPGRVEPILAALERIASATGPLTLTYTGLGFFPTPHQPRIVWAGIFEESGALNNIHAAIEASMQALGYDPEARAFHPHVTLGRVKGSQGISALRARVETCTFHQPPITLHEIALIKSDLRPSGSVYTILRRIPLSGNPHAGE